MNIGGAVKTVGVVVLAIATVADAAERNWTMLAIDGGFWVFAVGILLWRGAAPRRFDRWLNGAGPSGRKRERRSHMGGRG